MSQRNLFLQSSGWKSHLTTVEQTSKQGSSESCHSQGDLGAKCRQQGNRT